MDVGYEMRFVVKHSDHGYLDLDRLIAAAVSRNLFQICNMCGCVCVFSIVLEHSVLRSLFTCC